MMAGEMDNLDALSKASSGREPAHFKVTAQIRNPLSVLLFAHFGLCVGRSSPFPLR